MADLPEFVGPYKILDELGKGGFATVYLAHHKDSQDLQRVALKLPNSPENHRRFRREAETVAQLKHSNIIKIFDMAESEQTGAPYFTMEYISSGTLRDRLEAATSLPRAEAMEIVRQIGAALSLAHENGVIHRDVNPKNILLDGKQKSTHAILTDFGLVKPISAVENLTQTIHLIGAFNYFAPEQWNRENLSPATDVYALAITFFEILAGQRPFRGDIFTLRDKHLHEPPPRLSSVAPEIDPFFDNVLAKAIAKNLDDRYQSIIQFIEALEAANDKADLANAYYQDGLKAFAAGNPTDIDQAMQTLQSLLESLADLGAQHKKEDLQEKLRLLQIQTHYNQGTSAFVNGSAQNINQVIDILAEKVKILGEMHAKREQADLQKKLRLLQVKATYSEGVRAYESGNPANIEQSIDVLTGKIESLNQLQADRESADLQEKLKTLHIKGLYLTAVKTVDEADPENLAETIAFLEQSIQTLKPLKALRETHDLEQKLKLLRLQERDADNYKNIRALIGNKDYESALACLDIDFIQKGNYAYRDVTRLFWGVVYATQHSGNLPLEWAPSEWEAATQNNLDNATTPPLENNLKQDLEDQKKLNSYIALSFIPATIISVIIGAIFMAPTEVAQLRMPLIAVVVIITLCWAACSVYFYYQIYRPAELITLKKRMWSIVSATNEQ